VWVKGGLIFKRSVQISKKFTFMPGELADKGHFYFNSAIFLPENLWHDFGYFIRIRK
jgi:hypothetical protein